MFDLMTPQNTKPSTKQSCVGVRDKARNSEPCTKPRLVPLSRITSAPTTVLERQQLYRRGREHRVIPNFDNGNILPEGTYIQHAQSDNEQETVVKVEFCQGSVQSRVEEAVVLTEFGLYNAALERLQQLYHVQDNVVKFLVGKVSYKLGKSNFRPDISAWYLEQSVRCLTEILVSQPHHLAAAVYRTKALNRLHVLKHKLVPLVSTKYTKPCLQLRELKQSDSKFKKAVAVTMEINRQYSPRNRQESYSNFKLRILPMKMIKNSIWAMMKTAGEYLKYQRYLEGLDVVTTALKQCTNYSLYFCKSKCLIGIRNHQLVDKIPSIYEINTTNICETISNNLVMSCRLSRNCDFKVLFEFGRFLGTTNKVMEGVTQLKVSKYSKLKFVYCIVTF